MLALCVLSTGMQWDLLQAFAWGRMITSYSRTESVEQAVTDTFQGKMCSLCQMVANAHRQEQSRSPAAPAKSETKLLLFFQASPVRLALARHEQRMSAPVTPWLSLGRATPPVPPPRSATV